MEIQIQITSQMESEYVEREREFNSKTRLHCKPKESMWNRYHIHKVREWRIKETPSLTLYCRNGGDFNLLTPSSEDERHARNPSNHSKDLPLIHNGTKGAAAAGETNEGQKERNQPI